MKHWKTCLAFACVFGSGFSLLAWAGQVPNPINAPASVSATTFAAWTSTNPQAVVALTQAQLTADLNVFTSSLAGIVPASGGGTTNFLRADGTWAAPAGGGSCVTPGLAVLGCVFAINSVSHQWLQYLDTTGAFHLTQPAVADLSGLPVTLAQGGTGQTSAAAARASAGLDIDELTAHGDINYTILATDRTVVTNATFTAARTWTLPAANSVNAGQYIIIADMAGAITATNTLTVSRAGSDTIEGANTVVLNSAYSWIELSSDGVSKWADSTQIPFTAPSHQFFTSLTKAGGYAAAQPAFTDISGTASGAQLPLPTTSTLGGLESISCASHQWIDVIPTTQVQPTCAQPAVSDLSGLPVTIAQGGTNATTGTAAAKSLSVPYVICLAAPNNSHTGDTTLVDMLTSACKIPANTLATGNVIRIWALWSSAGANSTKIVKSTFNTSNATGGAACFASTIAANATATGEWESWLTVLGSSSENCYPLGVPGVTTTALVSYSLAISSDIYWVPTAQLGNAADTITLVAYAVEILQSAGN